MIITVQTVGKRSWTFAEVPLIIAERDRGCGLSEKEKNNLILTGIRLSSLIVLSVTLSS
jgi:hypothetical protein